MAEKLRLRYDPLYRVIDETEELRTVEGNFKSLFDRLKRISSLGIIPEVFEMARYPKYEHAIGVFYQVNNLLSVADKKTIPENYRIPLIIASLFLHLGHLPYTYSTERALLLASNLGDRKKTNKAKKYVLKKIEKVLDKIKLSVQDKEVIMENIFSLRDYKMLYRFFSAEILIDKWSKLKSESKLNLEEEDLQTIIGNLIDKGDDGYTYLNLADEADFVQRDALYFGTIQIDISPKHLYSEVLKHNSNSFVDEKGMIKYVLNYLTDKFYNNPEVIWFGRLYEKIVASLIISNNFNTEWLEDYDDFQFKELICDNMDKEKHKKRLPPKWVERAKDLFEKKINFSLVLDLKNISFKGKDAKDIIDVEYMLIGKKQSERGLLTYPFDTGILLALDYDGKKSYSLKVFQDDSNKSIYALLKLIKNLSRYLPIRDFIDYAAKIRESLAKQISWTGKVRFTNANLCLNENVIQAISKAIQAIEKSKKDHFIENCIKNLNEPWYNWYNYYYFIKLLSQEDFPAKIPETEIYKSFTKDLLSLPVRVLQYKRTKKFLDEIYNKLLEMLSSDLSKDEKGNVFEALWLIDRMRNKEGQFQFFLNGMIVTEDEGDSNEFDVIELIIRGNKAECWIYACSISDDYESKNRGQLEKLVRYISNTFPDLIIHTSYVIPTNKNANDWAPITKPTVYNYPSLNP